MLVRVQPSCESRLLRSCSARRGDAHASRARPLRRLRASGRRRLDRRGRRRRGRVAVTLDPRVSSGRLGVSSPRVRDPVGGKRAVRSLRRREPVAARDGLPFPFRTALPRSHPSPRRSRMGPVAPVVGHRSRPRISGGSAVVRLVRTRPRGAFRSCARRARRRSGNHSIGGVSLVGGGIVTLVVDVRGLSTRYGSVPVLRGVDFGLARAEVVGLIGRNGSGKTTFLRTLLGLARFEAGRIEWTGTGTAVPPDAVDHFGGAHTLPPHVQANIWVRLVSRGDAVCDDRRPLRALSRGSRQLLGLRAVLARTPLAAVLLDEPWEGLDPDGARWLTETPRRRRQEGS